MKNKISVSWLLIVCGVTCFGQSHERDIPKMRFTDHIVGEDGLPISDVQCTFLFNVDAVSYDKYKQVAFSTDANGNYTVEGYSERGDVSTTGQCLHKEGYYRGFGQGGSFNKRQDGRWLPWDQTYTTVLRKIGKPIPLYVKKMNADIPSVDIPVGYDLEAADWVAPNGKGKVVDFLITVTKFQYSNNNDYDVSALITFPNEDDGIQEIQLPKEFNAGDFKWPREAPINGYSSKLEARKLRQNTQPGIAQSINTAKETQAHFFRVRTLKKDGQIVSALYGKISGGIGIGPSYDKKAVIWFTYYLNPTANDRNLEFSGKTLFPNLPQEEIVRLP